MKICLLIGGFWFFHLPLPAAPAASTPPQPLPLKAYVDFAMSREGSAARGQQLFQADRRTGCAVCHSVDGTSSRVGPDLFTAGDKLPRRELIRSILEPSAAITIGYGTTSIETREGDLHMGVLKQVTTDGVELMLGDGKRARIPTLEILEQRDSAISLMPEGLQDGLSPQDFSDLVEYLVSLRQPEELSASSRGSPDPIPMLEKQIGIRPFFDEDFRFPHAFVHKPGDVRSGVVWFGQMPGLDQAFLVVHQSGKIWLMEKTQTGEQKSLFGDFAKELFNERGPNGLLGLAFHPQFARNRKYYLKHQVFEEGKIATVLVEKRAAGNFRHDSGEPSRRLLKIVSVTQDHSGGCIAFGPDGYLYLGMGDTGPQHDPNGHGQDLKLLLGKIVRIDVDRREATLPYAIPSDNPFRDRTNALPEIWARGFREPWRFTFDSLTGDLWVGDVGQDRVEEVAIVRRGENHGWNVYEGFELFSNRYRQEEEKYVPPIFAYKRKYGNSVTGGFVYRGNKASTFYGVYIFGDYTSKRIWGLTQKDGKLESIRQIGTSPQFIASFGTDSNGNIYLVGYEGMIYQLDFTGAVFERGAPEAKISSQSKPAWARKSFPLPESIWSVESLDLNRDGKLDLIAMGETKVFALVAPEWRQQLLADTREPKLLYCASWDADDDGDLDLAVGRYRVPWIEYRQARAAGKDLAEPKGMDFSVAWLENTGDLEKEWPIHSLDQELNGIHGLKTGDLTGDGKKELIADSIMGPAFPKSLAYFKPRTRVESAFKREIITRDGADGRPHYLDQADMNIDGRGDVLLGDSGGGTFTWWENPSGTNRLWTKHLIARENGATNIKAVDLDRDGVMDVVGSCGHGKGVFWFRGPKWEKQVIDAELASPHALAIGDFDGDGDVDVATASFTAHVVRWYENNGKNNFTAIDIDRENKQQAYDLKAVDLDADGRLDLILAGRESRNAVWYRNQPY